MASCLRWFAVLLLAGAALIAVRGQGSWPYPDSFDCSWIPSRSTWYSLGGTGACNAGFAAQCWPGRDEPRCAALPADVQNELYGGLFAAPQGNYYAQVGDYISCGECYQVKCDDPQCVPGLVITVKIADSCPCSDNPKWCCGASSQCQEMKVLPSLEGQPHCSALNGIWSERSLHLDLGEYAMNMMATGSRTTTGNNCNVINTYIRRVLCPAKGNVFLNVQSGNCGFQTGCWVGKGAASHQEPCFQSLGFSAVNVAGYGSVTRAQVVGRVWEYNAAVGDLSVRTLELPLTAVEPSKIEGRFAVFKLVTDGTAAMNLLLPFRIRLFNRLNESVLSREFTTDNFPQSCNSADGCYVDAGGQFPMPVLPAYAAECAAPNQTIPVVPSSTGAAPPASKCIASVKDVGSNPYWLAFNVQGTTGHTVAKVVAVKGGSSLALSGPANWGPGKTQVWSSSSSAEFAPPYVLKVTDSAANTGTFAVNALQASYTC